MSGRADAWFPFYAGDFVRDTGHLSACEVGAYLRLLCASWSTGGLPDDDARLARLAGMTPDEWARAALMVRPFWTKGDDGLLRQGRLERERERTARVSEKRRSAGAAGAAARWQAEGNADGKPMANATPEPSPPPSDAPSLHLEAPAAPARATGKHRDGEPGGFADWWAAYPRKVGKDAARKAYSAALKRASAADLLAGLKRAKFSDDPQFIPHPSTWLNAGRWQDEAGGTSSAATAAPIAAPDHPWWPRFASRLSATEFRQWIAPLRVTGEDEEAIHLAAPSRFHADHTRQNHDLALRAVFGKRVVITAAPAADKGN